MEDELEPALSSVIDRTSEDFSMTISSNKISEDVIERLHKKITNLHKAQMDIACQNAEADGQPTDAL